MYARVTTAQDHPHPEKAEEGIRLHRESVVPETRQQPGHTGTLLLVDRAQGKGITIDLYDTQAHAKAAEESGHDQRQIDKFAHLITAPVVQEVYEVAVHDIEVGRATAYARVTVGQHAPDKTDELIKIFRESVVPEVRQLKGYKGVLYLVDRTSGKGMSLSLWQTEAEMKASEEGGHYSRQVAKVLHLFSKPSSREVYEVTFHEVS